MKEITLNPVFSMTKNVREFEVMMDGLKLAAGEGCLAAVSSVAGRGKTRTAQWYHANNGCVYLRVIGIWRTSELEFLKALCVELGIKRPPSRKGPCFKAIIDNLINSLRPVFLDEIERLPAYFLDLVRDLSDISAAPFVLIGEEELADYMKLNKRVWSRTYRHIEFEPIKASDIILYTKQRTELELSPKVAAIFHGASQGDFRIVRRDIINLVQICNAKQTVEVDEEMARIAVKTGLSGS